MKDRKRAWSRYAALVVAVGLTAVCAFLLWAYLQPLPSTATPEGTVLRYYRLMQLGRVGSAQTLFAPELQSVWGAAPPFALTQELGLVGLRLDGSSPSAPDPSQGHDYTDNYSEFREVDVLYTQWWGDDMTTSPGGQFREVRLGRKGPGSPWVILEMGTGG